MSMVDDYGDRCVVGRYTDTHNIAVAGGRYTATNVGWICPRCDRVYAPTVDQCMTCNAKQAVS